MATTIFMADLLCPDAEARIKESEAAVKAYWGFFSVEEREAEQAAIQHDMNCLKQAKEVLNTGLCNPKYTRHWSGNPGEFVNEETGEILADTHLKFEGTMRDWYGTLVERAFSLFRDHAAL